MIARDLSWLSFNNRVLQEAADPAVPLRERIKFLGIVSNNLDEFFRVRVAALRKMIELGAKARMHLELNPEKILEEIQEKLLEQQDNFQQIWENIKKELAQQKIHLVTETELSREQEAFVSGYFSDEVRSYVVPLMIESMQAFPVLNDKSIYLACTLSKTDGSIPVRFALVSVPTRHLPRFIILPEHRGNKYIILLEDIIRSCLPKVFSFFGYDTFSAHVIKVTRDAEIDIDSDVSTSIIQKLEKGIKNRKKGKPVRFLYDSDINIFLLSYLQKRLGLTKNENIIPGARIHNFKDFMNFPSSLFDKKSERKKPFTQPQLADAPNIAEKLMQQDIMLHFPYHSFDSVIDLLREAAIDPAVTHIKITAYRLAPKSKIIHALTNAVRNGKQVTVVLELRARFDEEANLEWKAQLEEAGVKVLIGVPNMKVHAKICSIRRKEGTGFRYYGFVSTGNLNEKTATLYGDHCLLTSNRAILADINRIFLYLENPKTRIGLLKGCKKLIVSPTGMRKTLLSYIDREIKNARAGRKASIILKLNSLSDTQLIEKLEAAARTGVEVKLIIRGICCLITVNKKFKIPIQAVSIVDEYLEHARVMIFYNDGKEKIFISSADWMLRNIDHRVEAACPVTNAAIADELKNIINIQLADNVKARLLNNEQDNLYLKNGHKPLRSQVETYNYLHKKIIRKS